MWKISFKSIVNEFNVLLFEEMDLFVKWLGLIFSIFVFSICVFNVYVFERGF